MDIVDEVDVDAWVNGRTDSFGVWQSAHPILVASRVAKIFQRQKICICARLFK